jgi:hypothetical protein
MVAIFLTWGEPIEADALASAGNIFLITSDFAISSMVIMTVNELESLENLPIS